MTSEEARRAYETEDLLIIPTESDKEYQKYINAQSVRRLSYTSRYGHQLKKSEIKELLQDIYPSRSSIEYEEFALNKKIINF